jgi:phage terminase Nu1 subunit (DNA packaging protein)
VTSRPSAVVPQERAVDAQELAAIMGVSVRTIKRWTAEGMTSEDWGIRVRRYYPSEAIAWCEQRARMGAAPAGHSEATGERQPKE